MIRWFAAGVALGMLAALAFLVKSADDLADGVRELVQR